MTERWLPVVGYEGLYEVSDLGRVRRMKVNAGTATTRLLKPYLGNTGYFVVTLYGERRIHYCIHRLIAASFLGPCPPGYTVNHIDGIKTQNYYKNLEYLTNAENLRHALLHGLSPRGSRIGISKLTDEKVSRIKKLLARMTHREIGEMFGVTRSTISYIADGKTWKHVN